VTGRSPLWRWSDVVAWHQPQEDQGEGAEVLQKPAPPGADIAALNAALDLLRHVPPEDARRLLDRLSQPVPVKRMAGLDKAARHGIRKLDFRRFCQGP
jgi:hypothetical protein